MADVADTSAGPAQTSAAPNPNKYFKWEPDEVQFTYEQHGGDTEHVLARMTTEIMNNMPEFQGQMDYDELQLGTAPILRSINFGPDQQGKGLTDDQILRYFTSMKTLGEDGAPTETTAFLSGLTRGTASLATGIASAKAATAAAPPYIPLPGPAAPLGVFSKPAAGTAGFITGSLLGDFFIGSPISNMLFEGPADVQLTPRAEAKFRGFESAGSVLPFIIMPQFAPRAAFSTFDSLKQLPVGLYKPGRHVAASRLTAEDMANPLITQYLAGKLSGVPTTKAFTQLRNQIFKQAKESGGEMTLKEAGKIAAKRLNRPGAMTRGTSAAINFAEKALVTGGTMFRDAGLKGKGVMLGVESLAVPATGAAVNIIESEFPRSPGARLGAEVVGSLAPQVSLLKFIPSMYKGIGNYITRRKESVALGRGLDMFGTQSRARGRAINSLFDIFDQNQDNPEALLSAMEDLMVEPVIQNGEIVSYQLKPAFRAIADQGVDAKGKQLPNAPIFTSQFIDNPSIMQLEQLTLGRSSRSGLSLQRDKSFIKSLEMQRGAIFALRGSGDPDLVKIAGQMMQDRLSILVADRMDRAINQTIASVRQIYPEGGEEASRVLGERLAQVVATQEDLFRRLEKNAWTKVDKNSPIDTFYRKDPETDEFVENAVPNFVEEWDAILAQTDPAELPSLMRVPEFRDINDRVVEVKKQLGLDASDAFSDRPAAVTKFEEAYKNAMGLPARDSYARLLRDAGIISDTSSPIIEATEDNIAALGQLENRLGRSSKGTKSVELIRLQREALIAELAQQQGAQATGVVVEPVTQGNLTSIYSLMRTVARREGTVNDNVARVANNVADAALDDLNGRPFGNPAYDAARDISYAFNTYLKRAFGGDIMQTNARGKRIVAPQLLTGKLMTGKPDAVALRIEQIQNIGSQINKYAKDTGYEIVTGSEIDDSIGTANEVLRDVLKLALREIEIPLETRTTGTPLQIAQAQNEAMQQFRSRNAQVFTAFPELGRMIDEAADAGVFLQRAKKTVGRLEKLVSEQKAFQKLTGASNPEQAVRVAFQSDNPMKELDSLVEIIRAGSDSRTLSRYLRNKGMKNVDVEALNIPDAKAGLRRSVMSWAFLSGGKHGDQFNAGAAYNALFERIPKASKDTDTMAKWMVDNDIMDEKEIQSLKLGLQTIIQTETRKNVSDAIIQGQTSPLEDLYTRITGAKLGSAVGDLMPGGRGAGLVEAEAGSRYLRTLTQELPALQEMDALETILLDPELLALALRQGRNASEKTGIVRTLLNKLAEVGIGMGPGAAQRAIPLGAQEIVEPKISSDPPVTEEEPVGPVTSVAPTTMPAPPPPQIPTQPVAQPTTAVASAAPRVAPPPPPTPTGPVDRARFAALFPEDRDLVQGIGSLM